MLDSSLTIYTEEDVINHLTHITELKSNLVNFLHEYYNNFHDVESDINYVKDQFKEMKCEWENVVKNSEITCKELSFSSNDKEKYLKQLESLETIKLHIENLLKLHKKIETIQIFNDDGLILDSNLLNGLTTELKDITTILANKTLISKEKLNLFRALVHKKTELEHKLSKQLNQLLNDTIHQIGANKSSSDTSLVIKASISELESLINLTKRLDPSNTKLKSILQFIFIEIINPVIENFPRSCLKITKEDCKLSILYFEDNKLTDRTDNVVNFVENLTEALQLLYNRLLSFKPFESLLSSYFTEELFNSFVENVLNDIKLEKVPVLQQKLEELLEFIDNNKLNSNQQAVQLINFVENFTEKSRDNTVLEYLSNTREHYLNSILDSVEIGGSDANLGYNINDYQDKLSSEQKDLLKLVDWSKLIFPKCSISENVIDSVSIIKYQLEAYASETGATYNLEEIEGIIDFLRVVPQLIEMYLIVVPVANRRALQDIPLAVALHYNNCMYLSHYCMHWSVQVKSLAAIFVKQLTQLSLSTVNPQAGDTSTGGVGASFAHTSLSANYDPSILNNMEYIAANFNLIPAMYRLRDEADTILSKEINKQRDQINEFLEVFTDFKDISTTNKLTVEMAFRKSLSYLINLSKVFEVLPVTIYDKVICNLVNSIARQIITKCLQMTDILSSDADQLHIIITNFIDHIYTDLVTARINKCQTNQNKDNTELLVASEYLTKNCSQWQKLEFINFVLTANLLAIEQKWNDYVSKSTPPPMKSDELKCLVKALFKSSHMRTNLLDKLM